MRTTLDIEHDIPEAAKARRTRLTTGTALPEPARQALTQLPSQPAPARTAQSTVGGFKPSGKPWRRGDQRLDRSPAGRAEQAHLLDGLLIRPARLCGRSRG